MEFTNMLRSKALQRLFVFVASYTALTAGAKQFNIVDPARDIATCLSFYCAALVLAVSLESGVQMLSNDTYHLR